MRVAIEPFLDEHARFDRWARRLSLGDSAFRSREALEEAAFAPLRERRRVVAAWLQRVGPDPLELRYPGDAPALPGDGWVRVRTESHGEVRAQRRELTVGESRRRLTLIRRSEPAPGGATLHVTMGFSAASEEP